jgi:glutathione S-transferase
MKGRSAMRTEHTHTITRCRGGEPGRTHPGRRGDVTQIQGEPSDHPDVVVPVLWQLQVSHYVEKVRWALDYKRVPHIRRTLLPGLHALKTKHLTGDTSTAPVLTIDGRSIGDSTRIIAAIEERWPQPPLYPEDAAHRRRALELEEFFDEELGPHIRRAFYNELLSHPDLVVPLFTYRRPFPARILLRAGFPMLRVAMRRRFEITAESAAASRAKMVAAMDRLERQISSSGFLVGESFTVADLTAAALFYGVARPLEFPYPMVADDDLPNSWREFVDSLAHRPGGKWLAEIYRRHRGASAELTPAKPPRPRPDLAVAQGTR